MSLLRNPLQGADGSLVFPERQSAGGSSSTAGDDGASPAAPSGVVSLGKKGGKDANGKPPTLRKEKKDGEKKKDGWKKAVSPPPSISPSFSDFCPCLFARVSKDRMGGGGISFLKYAAGWVLSGAATLPILLFFRCF